MIASTFPQQASGIFFTKTPRRKSRNSIREKQLTPLTTSRGQRVPGNGDHGRSLSHRDRGAGTGQTRPPPSTWPMHSYFRSPPMPWCWCREFLARNLSARATRRRQDCRRRWARASLRFRLRQHLLNFVRTYRCALRPRYEPWSQNPAGASSTVKVPNFPPHGSFAYFLAKCMASLGEINHKNE
jgi:hypothetical protein